MKLWRKPFDHDDKARPPAQIHIDKERCKGCGYCVEFCAQKVLSMSSEIGPKGYKLPQVGDSSKCLDCGFCQAICPEFAIKLSTSEDKVEAVKK
jgi:2-oxoglutarate ferredoxin oxidoreductase subunit delta